MSRVRIHNFSISLDGFATGEGLSLDAPFGHAGHRLHEWMIATRFGHQEVLGESGGTEGVDHVASSTSRSPDDEARLHLEIAAPVPRERVTGQTGRSTWSDRTTRWRATVRGMTRATTSITPPTMATIQP